MFSKIGYIEDHHHSLHREIPLMGTEFDKVYSEASKITDTLELLWHLILLLKSFRDKNFCVSFGVSIPL